MPYLWREYGTRVDHKWIGVMATPAMFIEKIVVTNLIRRSDRVYWTCVQVRVFLRHGVTLA
jgi:hypothetical protein